MKKYISFILLITASRFLILSEGSKGVIGFDDITIIKSPIERSSSSGSDASASSPSPDTPSSYKRNLPGWVPRPKLDLHDMKPGDIKPFSGGEYDPICGKFVPHEDESDLAKYEGKSDLAKEEPLYKRFLVLLGCAPRIKPKGNLEEES